MTFDEITRINNRRLARYGQKYYYADKVYIGNSNGTLSLYTTSNDNSATINDIQNQLILIEQEIADLDDNKVPITRLITINGVTYDLSQDRSWTVGGGGLPCPTSNTLVDGGDFVNPCDRTLIDGGNF